jgi:hypothetical protein
MPQSKLFIGERGMTLIEERIYTPADNLATAIPSANAKYSKLSAASYINRYYIDLTIWMRGFFNPVISSNYEFSVQSIGNFVLFVSNSESPDQKEVKQFLFDSIYQ